MDQKFIEALRACFQSHDHGGFIQNAIGDNPLIREATISKETSRCSHFQTPHKNFAVIVEASSMLASMHQLLPWRTIWVMENMPQQWTTALAAAMQIFKIEHDLWHEFEDPRAITCAYKMKGIHGRIRGRSEEEIRSSLRRIFRIDLGVVLVLNFL